MVNFEGTAQNTSTCDLINTGKWMHVCNMLISGRINEKPVTDYQFEGEVRNSWLEEEQGGDFLLSKLFKLLMLKIVNISYYGFKTISFLKD